MRGRLLENVFRPILERYRGDKTIAAWDMINEPEWVTLGLGATNPLSGSDASGARRFYRRDGLTDS